MVSNYLRRWPLRTLLVVWLAASAYSALTMYGFHQEDEVGQITAFYLHKAGELSADELPWEHKHAVRPWIQPAVYFALFGGEISRSGYNHLFFERVSYVLSFFLIVAAVLAFGSLLMKGRDGPLRRGSVLAVAVVASVWFLPSFALRHSSEALAAVLLVGFLWLWERGETRSGIYPAVAGALAGLTFWVRFHTGIFFVGWFVAGLAFRRRERYWLSIGRMAIAFVAVCAAMVVVDSWGYGRFELTPWNYFEDQVVKDVASYFGVFGVEWYFVEGSLALLNPLFFVWFAIVMRRGWGDRFSRSVACGIAVFFVVHSLTPHKELRFLVPVLPIAMLLVARDFLWRDWTAAWERRVAHPVYLRVVIGLNIAAFVLFAASGTKSPRNQVEFSVWKIETPATVFSATNLFQYFDGALEEPPFFVGLPDVGLLNARFRKPPGVEYVYAPPERFYEACSTDPHAYVLVTSGQSDRGGQLIDDEKVVSQEEFPPSWLAGLLSSTRTWRFKLVRCVDLPG